MKSASTGALLLGVAGIAAVAMGGDVGCSPSKPTEIVPGALTQVRVPKDLAAIQIEVKANGVTKFCQGYEVSTGGIVLLPSTLGVIEGAPNTTVRVTVRGYDNANSPDVQGCGGLGVDDPGTADTPGPGPRVLRRATLTYVNQHTLFLPMQLSFACYDNSSCTDTQTCVAGQCLDDTVDPGTLADYDPSLLDGTQVCFSPSGCFASPVEATVVDANNCVYTLPPAFLQNLPPGVTLSSLPSSMNVRIAYAQNQWVKDPGTGEYVTQAGAPFEEEILNQDANEGFTVDTSNAGQFALAPGLCSLVKAGTTSPPDKPSSGTKVFPVISNVQVGVGCSPKKLLLPFCSNEQNKNVNDNPPAVSCGVAVPLVASPSAVYILVDNSKSMDAAFGPEGYATAMALSFADPIFRKTYIAFDFLHHKDAECGAATTTYTAPGITDFKLPPEAQPQIAPKLIAPTFTDSAGSYLPLDLGAALDVNAGAYRRVSDFIGLVQTATKTQNPLNDPAVMVFVNRIPTDPGASDGGAPDGGSNDNNGLDCPPASGKSVQQTLADDVVAAGKKGIHTYFVVLDNHQANGPSTRQWFQDLATAVASSGGTASMVDVIDATSTSGQAVFQGFQSKLGGAVTCVYDQPAGIDNTATLTFAGGIPVKPSSSCNLANKNNASADGWNIDNGHVVICGNSCQQVQSAIGAATFGALQDAGVLNDAGTFDFDGGTIAVPDVPVVATMPCQ